ncbi:MAG: DNA methyltransferase, partial [Opitutales bacterium]
MFAEDVELLPKGCFTELLVKLKANPGGFAPQLQTLWRDMNDETEWSVALMQNIAYFNGGLFENAAALPLKADQIAILIGAAKQNWAEVEPAIFGTLLERALSPEDRHKLGAHYTPRSYVERLVKPTVIDPLRSQWNDVKGAALQLHTSGKPAEAIDQIHAFHRELCQIRVLDPACGSGNFLYVVLEHMKRLESEVLELLQTLGDTELTFEMEQFKVRPQQFLGLELNERAVAIAQLVLWIGYFQWHRKTTGTADTKDRPLLPKERTIRHQDAVLAYDTPVPRTVEAASSRFSEVALNKRQDAAATDERQDAASTCAYLNPFKELQETKSNLPHWRQEGVSYFVTFRQADSIPQTKLKKWAAEKESWSAINPGPHTPEQRR